MRRTYHLLLATSIIAAPMPVAAQVAVDLNALNALGAAPLPAPPPGAPRSIRRDHHRTRHLARTEREGQHAKATSVASAAPAPAPAGPETIEHPANLGPSFTSLPALPGVAPPVPPPPSVLPGASLPASPVPPTATKAPASVAPPLPVETAAATPKPVAAPKPVAVPKPVTTPAAAAPAAPQLALPRAAPAPPALASTTPTRLAEATPPPPAAKPAPPKPAPTGLPKGADRLTLPFFVAESDLPAAETAMLRDFAQRSGGKAQYIIRAFASQPAGDDDPSTPRRIALQRAQSVSAALTDSGVEPARVRLLALGNAGGAPADRVEVIAMPPPSGHTDTDSSP